MVENLRRNDFTISYLTLNKENDSIDKKKRAERVRLRVPLSHLIPLGVDLRTFGHTTIEKIQGYRCPIFSPIVHLARMLVLVLPQQNFRFFLAKNCVFGTGRQYVKNVLQ